MSAADGTHPVSERTRGIRAILPGDTGQQQLPVATARHLPPQLSEWLPELLADLLPATTTSLRRLAHEYDDAYDRNIVETRRPGPFVYDHLIEELGCDALATHYASALTDYALKYSQEAYDELPDRHQATYDQLEHFLTQFGTGAGPFDRGIEALKQGPIAIHRQDVPSQTIRVTLDAPAWKDVSDQRTAARSLSALAALGETFDVAIVVTSPSLLRQLHRHHREWVDEHLGALDFTGHGIPSRCESSTAAVEEAAVRKQAFTALADLDEEGGRRRLLAALPEEGYREQRTLIEDPVVDLAESSVSNYLSDLTAAGLVTVDADGRTYNRVSLTEVGRIAQEYIAADHTLRDPRQSTFDREFAPTHHTNTSRVYRARAGREGGERPTTAEDWLADTGDASERGYVAWLGGPSDVLDNYGMHERLRAARRTQGVTLVDHAIKPFDDGRKAYLSCFDDEVQAVVQWGGPLPTLARCTATLLSNHAFSRLLTASRIGSAFDELYDEFDEAVERILVKGAQLGWLSEDEHEYTGFKNRYRTVRNLCLERLPKVLESDDQEANAELLRDFHGLFASATQLYDAAGYDVTIHLRVPDTAQLLENPSQRHSFVEFFGQTIPKHTVYESDVGVHSGYREVLEQREEKLTSRLAFDLDPEAPQATCTASWVVSGPTATEFEGPIYDSIQTQANALREAIRAGDEDAPLLKIPVVTGMRSPAIKAVITRIAGRKGYLTDREALHQPGVRDRRPLERCLRVLMGCLSTAERPGMVSPFDVAEALLHCSSTHRVEPLTPSDVAYGLAHLPAARLLPEQPPSATKIVQVCLLADGPIGRSEICERAAISTSSYDRHIGELATLAIIEPHTVQGRRKWAAHLEPWWAPGTGTQMPYSEDSPQVGGWDLYLREVLAIVTEETDPQLPTELWEWSPVPDIPTIREQAVGLTPWLPFIASQFGIADTDEITGNENGGDLIVSSDDEPAVASPVESECQRTVHIGMTPESTTIQESILR